MLCAVFVLSISVNAFASEVSENIENSEGQPVPDVDDGLSPDDYYTGDTYLNMILADIQGDINSLSGEVTNLNERIDTLSELPSEEPTDLPADETNVDENPSLGPSSDEVIVTDVHVRSVSPVTPSDTTGLKSVLLRVLGNYDAIIVEYQYQNANNSYYSYLREVQPDYPWMASFLMLSLVVYCLFRLGGGILGRD